MLTSSLIDRVSEVLQDVGRTTWTEQQLLEWANDAVRSLVLVRPDTTAVKESVALVDGTSQRLIGANDLRFIQATRNMGSSGSIPGRAITQGDVRAMDAYNPSWHTDSSGQEVRHYFFDEARPREFWVYPPVSLALGPVYVEVVKSVVPGVITAVGDTVPVDDIYAPALIEWMLYRAFIRDADDTPSVTRATWHFRGFFNLLQVKMRADMAIHPKVREAASSAQAAVAQ